LWLPQPLFQAETTGPPRFLGDPLWTCPALRPRRNLRARPSRPSGAAFRNTEIVGFRNQLTFEAQSRGLSTRCLRFAGWITPPPRKTRFWLLASFARWDWLPTGSHYKVSGELCHPSSSPRLGLAHLRTQRSHACSVLPVFSSMSRDAKSRRDPRNGLDSVCRREMVPLIRWASTSW